MCGFTGFMGISWRRMEERQVYVMRTRRRGGLGGLFPGVAPFVWGRAGVDLKESGFPVWCLMMCTDLWQSGVLCNTQVIFNDADSCLNSSKDVYWWFIKHYSAVLKSVKFAFHTRAENYPMFKEGLSRSTCEDSEQNFTHWIIQTQTIHKYNHRIWLISVIYN